MNGTYSLDSRRNNLTVIYGTDAPVAEGGAGEMAMASFSYIVCDMNDIRDRYIKLGFHLCEADRNRYYLEFGYNSIADFAFANFGLDKGTVSRCMNVSKKFSSGDNTSSFLDDKYKEYSYSQLSEMVSLDPQQLKKVKPDMTVRQIREYKKTGKLPSGCDVATDNPEEKLHDAVKKFFDGLRSECKEHDRRLTKEYCQYLVKYLMSCHSYCSDYYGVEYSMKPYEVSFNGLPPVSFNQLFSLASESGVIFAESQDYMVYPAWISGFDSDAFAKDIIEHICTYVYAVGRNSHKDVKSLSDKGKKLTWESGGKIFTIQFSVSQNKDD